MYPFSRYKHHYGITLVELVIAAAILALITLATLSAMIVSSRVSRDALEDISAMELLNRQTELLRSVTPAQYPLLGTAQVPQFFGTVPFVPDPEMQDALPTFNIRYEWYGFGNATGGGSNSLQFNDEDWPDGVNFTDHRVLIRPTPMIRTSGIATITSHGEGSFSTDARINGYTSAGWGFNILPGAYFEVDGGKWCRMTIEWTTSSGSDRQVVRDVFIPWRSIVSAS